jgi:hypothetical protein
MHTANFLALLLMAKPQAAASWLNICCKPTDSSASKKINLPFTRPACRRGFFCCSCGLLAWSSCPGEATVLCMSFAPVIHLARISPLLLVLMCILLPRTSTLAHIGARARMTETFLSAAAEALAHEPGLEFNTSDFLQDGHNEQLVNTRPKVNYRRSTE